MNAMLGKRIAFILLGDRRKASSRVRGWWIGEELERRGHEVDYFVTNSRYDYVRLAAQLRKTDIVIFQKQYGRYDIMLARMARWLGKTVYFDIDDAPSRNASPVSIANARRMMRLCDGVLVGSRKLERLALEETDNVTLVPSSVRLASYKPGRDNEAKAKPCLGWIGNGAHYAQDLVEILAPAVASLAQTRNFSLRIVGGCGDRRLHDTFSQIDRLDCEIIDDLDWSSPDAVSNSTAPFDIGLYPLNPGPVNDYKCAFKAVEYMAWGLPVIASDVGANADVVIEGKTGLLVRNEGWIEAIAKLIDNPQHCLAMGHSGRKRAEQHFTIERACDRLEFALNVPSNGSDQTRHLSELNQ